MPFGFGGGKSGSSERGGEKKPLEFSDLRLTDEQQERVQFLIDRETGNKRPLDQLTEDWDKAGELRRVGRTERSVVFGHMIGEVRSRREAAAKEAAEAAGAGQPTQG